MREGSLEAPTRHVIEWQNPDFYDEAKLDAELRRVFDICHGCRRCFNLCDSFPRLFDLIDESPTGELDEVKSADFKPVVDACTLCDMCFMSKCPYVPPHEFDLDFPHLMLRYRAVEAKKKQIPVGQKQLGETDRNGRLATLLSPLANWAAAPDNSMTRPMMERIAGVHREAELPAYAGKTLEVQAAQEPAEVDEAAPAFGRKAVIYATCFGNYNATAIGMATRAVLAKNGVETAVLHPRCCGMPKLEAGELGAVAATAKATAADFKAWVDAGYDIVALVPSCALMLKFEWPLIVPEDEDVKRLARATFDVSEYVVDIARKEGLADGLQPLEGGVAVHIACHARAQNMGQKAAEMLRLIPKADLQVMERCSGHGGSWGVMKENFETALKVGKPVARQANKSGARWVSSECPLAGMHIRQGMEKLGEAASAPERGAPHPIELFARAYGLTEA
jgi:glycerol-3-phosphate dehydrogenase subunit C